MCARLLNNSNVKSTTKPLNLRKNAVLLTWALQHLYGLVCCAARMTVPQFSKYWTWSSAVHCQCWYYTSFQVNSTTYEVVNLLVAVEGFSSRLASDAPDRQSTRKFVRFWKKLQDFLWTFMSHIESYENFESIKAQDWLRISWWELRHFHHTVYQSFNACSFIFTCVL